MSHRRRTSQEQALDTPAKHAQAVTFTGISQRAVEFLL
jgi:hypothetical protein